ncbi:hypothetical protein [Streptacidiphilus anmyonensis]|uniref:hypothetical protein n=1 Tax=Streptacidiphilus anmyonensis TaxID=405782 RepID=UPI0006943A1B|nr:hypothetical protein [Streptacidiphilus anmyonensis]
MAMRRRAIASALASAALPMMLCCAGPALASDAAPAPGGGTTLVTVSGGPPQAAVAAAPRGAVRPKAQPPLVLETLTVDPEQSRPGATVDLRTFADCGDTSTGEVRSAAFAAPVALALAADGGLYAAARLAPDVKPGSYLVHEFCAGHPVAAGRLTIADLGAPAAGGGWRVLGAQSAAATPSAPAPPTFPRDAALGLVLASLTGLATLGLRRLGFHVRLHAHPADADA